MTVYGEEEYVVSHLNSLRYVEVEGEYHETPFQAFEAVHMIKTPQAEEKKKSESPIFSFKDAQAIVEAGNPDGWVMFWKLCRNLINIVWDSAQVSQEWLRRLQTFVLQSDLLVGALSMMGMLMLLTPRRIVTVTSTTGFIQVSQAKVFATGLLKMSSKLPELWSNFLVFRYHVIIHALCPRRSESLCMGHLVSFFKSLSLNKMDVFAFKNCVPFLSFYILSFL